MRTLLAIIYCFLNLAGCTDAQNRSIVATAQENGIVILDKWVYWTNYVPHGRVMRTLKD